jgi:hypothetical protein
MLVIQDEEMPEEEYQDDLSELEHPDKRAWNSGFAGGMGKRAWNSGFAGGMGKRAWNSGKVEKSHSNNVLYLKISTFR